MGINYRIIQQTALIIREKVTCMPPSIFYNGMPRAQRLICWRQAPQKGQHVSFKQKILGGNPSPVEILKPSRSPDWPPTSSPLNSRAFPQSMIHIDPPMPPCNVEAPCPHGTCPVWEIVQKEKCHQSLSCFCSYSFLMERSQSSNKKKTIIMAKYTLKSNPNMPGNGEIL